MLSLSNKNVIETLKIFKSNNIDVAFIVPTSTGLKKSIMDATNSVRNFFLQKGIHDFDEQQQGEEHKVICQTTLIVDKTIVNTKTSFYRPRTKSGDPRIWIYKLTKYAKEGDLLAFIKTENVLSVINCSRTDFQYLFDPNNVAVRKYVSSVNSMSSVAEELLEKCRDISKKRFVESLRRGDTGIGYTFETLLGISSNNKRYPDYKGIEIKTTRSYKNRSTLFSKAPSWKLSNIKKVLGAGRETRKISDNYGKF